MINEPDRLTESESAITKIKASVEFRKSEYQRLTKKTNLTIAEEELLNQEFNNIVDYPIIPWSMQEAYIANMHIIKYRLFQDNTFNIEVLNDALKTIASSQDYHPILRFIQCIELADFLLTQYNKLQDNYFNKQLVLSKIMDLVHGEPTTDPEKEG